MIVYIHGYQCKLTGSPLWAGRVDVKWFHRKTAQQRRLKAHEKGLGKARLKARSDTNLLIGATKGI